MTHLHHPLQGSGQKDLSASGRGVTSGCCSAVVPVQELDGKQSLGVGGADEDPPLSVDSSVHSWGGGETGLQRCNPSLLPW